MTQESTVWNEIRFNMSGTLGRVVQMPGPRTEGKRVLQKDVESYLQPLIFSKLENFQGFQKVLTFHTNCHRPVSVQVCKAQHRFALYFKAARLLPGLSILVLRRLVRMYV